MVLNRFQGKTVQDALRAVRESLGADAFVLSTRTVPARGWRGTFGRQAIEITAVSRHGLSENRQADDARRAADAARRLEVQRQVDARAVTEIAARLEATGLDSSLARDVAGSLPRHRRRGLPLTTLRKTLEPPLAALAGGDDAPPPVEVFIGPPGAGKTTTIAKIAARERARGGRRYRLIAADGFRVGAVEQLRLFADIMGAPVTVTRTAADVRRALETIKGPVLIDTAGRSPRDAASQDLLRVFAERRDTRIHLVLPADLAPAAARAAIARFRDCGATALVLTRLDEAGTLAPLVSIVRDAGLRVSYLGTGQDVPSDLELATPSVLAAWVAGEPGSGAVA